MSIIYIMLFMYSDKNKNGYQHLLKIKAHTTFLIPIWQNGSHLKPILFQSMFLPILSSQVHGVVLVTTGTSVVASPVVFILHK